MAQDSVVAVAADRRAAAEQELLQSDVEVRKLVLDAVKKSAPTIRAEGSLIDGDVMRTIDGASQVTLTIHDYAREILKSGAVQNQNGSLTAIDINTDGLWFRLAKLTKQGDDLPMTFESRAVSLLRELKGPRKIGSRAKITRAEAILALVRSVHQFKIPVRINELHVKQPIAQLTDSERQDRVNHKQNKTDALRKAGFPKGVKIPGLNARQIWRIGRCLKTAQKIPGVTERCCLAMLVAMAQESDFGENTGGRGTTFQTQDIPETNLEEQAKYFMIGGKSFRDGAIQAIHDHPTWTVGWIAVWVENPGSPSAFGPLYDKHFPLARKIMDAWGGVTTTGVDTQQVVTYNKQYAFMVHRKESYWDAIQRLADDVNWRAFMVGEVFHYISETDLFEAAPRAILKESLPGVEGIDFDYDYRKPLNKAQATVRLDRWAIPPGAVVLIEDLGPANGRWLVETVTRGLFSAEATLDLIKPLAEKKEPRSDTATKKKKKSHKLVGTPFGSNTQGSYGDRLFKSAKEIGSHHLPYVWGGGHGHAGTPSIGVPGGSGYDGHTKGFDCSGGVAACLKLAGLLPAEWVNGVPGSGTMAQSFGEAGVGETHTLWAHGGHVFLEVLVDGVLHHLGTGRWGTSFGGFGPKPVLHPHSGFTPRHLPERNTGSKTSPDYSGANP